MWGWENLSAATPRGRFVFLCLVMAVATLLTLLEVVTTIIVRQRGSRRWTSASS